MENVQINSDPEKKTINLSNDENICDSGFHDNNNNNLNENCNPNFESSVEPLNKNTFEKTSTEETADTKEENKNVQNPAKYVPVRYSYSGSYFDKQFAEIEVQMNLVEVKNSLAKTCEILKEINFLESLRKGSKLSGKTLEFSEEVIELDKVSTIPEQEPTS